MTIRGGGVPYPSMALVPLFVEWARRSELPRRCAWLHHGPIPRGIAEYKVAAHARGATGELPSDPIGAGFAVDRRAWPASPRLIASQGLWVCGRSAPPTGCASPASRAKLAKRGNARLRPHTHSRNQQSANKYRWIKRRNRGIRHRPTQKALD
jgi:hypothetical protein